MLVYEEAIAKNLLTQAKKVVRLLTPPIEIGMRIESRDPLPDDFLKKRVAGPHEVFVPNQFRCYVANTCSSPRWVKILVFCGADVQLETDEEILKPGQTRWLVYSEETMEQMRQADWETYKNRSFNYYAAVYCMFVGEGAASDYRAGAGVYERLGAECRPIIYTAAT